MKFQNRQQALVAVAGIAVALWAGDRLVVTPLVRTWKARSEEVGRLEKSVGQGAALLEREQAIRERWESMRTGFLSNEVSVAESQVLKAFERWSRQSGISVSGIRPQWKQTAEDLMTLDCRADAVGSLSQVARFLYEVEKDPLAFKIEGVDITARDTEGQQLALALQVSGLVTPAEKR
ncbi:MAG TPA: hypothetical protein PKM73_11390 [Verrucomicrobiota bacterium]|nr:hypothetical protein [Verrucomicrobiota bacterium]HNU50549.1 hypothetical protein [Verrucomicrobiota bacterium]